MCGGGGGGGVSRDHVCVCVLQMQLLLSLLVTYDRCHPPSEEEEEWHSTHCRSVCKAAQVSSSLLSTTCSPTTHLPQDLSSQRLPLHMLLQPQLGLHLLGEQQ